MSAELKAIIWSQQHNPCSSATIIHYLPAWEWLKRQMPIRLPEEKP